MRKGFTLIELLAVVTIIGLIFLLVIPKITTSLKNKKDDVDITTNNMIIAAARLYVNERSNSFDKIDNNVYCLPLTTLTKKGYLESPVKNTTDDKDITDIKSVKIVYDKGFKYEIVDKKDCSVVVAEKEKSDYIDNDGNKYKKISYVETTGIQYINTGVYPSTSTNAEYTVQILEFKSGGPHILSSRNYYFPHIKSNGTAIYSRRDGAESTISNKSFDSNTIYTFKAFWNDRIIINDVDYGKLTSSGALDATSLYLGTSAREPTNEQYLSDIRIYACKIYDGDTLVRNYIPVVDDKYTACLFDDVEKKCYYNDGLGTFKYDYSQFDLSDKSLNSALLAKVNNGSISTYESGNTHEMYTFDHTATDQTPALIDYRYIGNDPNNYIQYNDEVWRIIGVFTVEDENGVSKQRIKIIKDGKIGTKSIKYSSNGTNYWIDSDMKTYLNGDYYNSLKPQYKSLIKASKYYLAGKVGAAYNGATIYGYERGNETLVTDGVAKDKYWVGNIALMYPSDYSYTFSLGVDDVCYNNITLCKTANNGNPEKSWIYNSLSLLNGNKYTWFITASPYYSQYIYLLMNAGHISTYGVLSNSYYTMAVAYLDTDVEYVVGDGSKKRPYILSAGR